MYRETITHQELCDARSAVEADWILRSRLRQLMERTGAHNVKSAVLRRWEDLSRSTYEAGVSFDSRAWTGRA